MNTTILNIKLSLKPFLFIFLSCFFSIKKVNSPQIKNSSTDHHISQKNIFIRFYQWIINNKWKKQNSQVDTEIKNQNKILNSNENDKLEERFSSSLQIENILEFESSSSEIYGLTPITSPSIASSGNSSFIVSCSLNRNFLTDEIFIDHNFNKINTIEDDNNVAQQTITIEESTQSVYCDQKQEQEQEQEQEQDISQSTYSILKKCSLSFKTPFDNLKAYLKFYLFKPFVKYTSNKMQQDSSKNQSYVSKCALTILKNKRCTSCISKIFSYEICANAARSIILPYVEAMYEDKPQSSSKSYLSILEPMKNIKHQFYKENNTQLNFDQLKNKNNNKFSNDFYPQRKISQLFSDENSDNKNNKKFSTKNAIIVIGIVSLAYAISYINSSKKIDIII